MDVVIPAGVQRVDAGFARLHRTVRLPRGFCVAGEIRYALPPRAVADAARWLTNIGDVRAVVSGRDPQRAGCRERPVAASGADRAGPVTAVRMGCLMGGPP